MVRMQKRINAVLEGVVIGAIVLVLVQTFLEDFATLIGWSWNLRRALIFTGFAFDVFFTIEFLVRIYTSIYQGRGLEYFAYRRGWIDFVASIPLLLFSSGPAVLTVVAGGTMMFAVGGILNVLKVIKAVRIARILRLLRVLKIFKQIKYTDSVMAQRHVAKITAMVVSLFVLVVFVLSIVTGILGVPSAEDVVSEKQQRTADEIIAVSSRGPIADELLESIAKRNEDLLIVKVEQTTKYSRYENDRYDEEFGPSDYRYIEEGSLSFFFDNREAAKLQSKDNIAFFIIIVLLVVLLLVYYSPHFALTVTDPIHVMRKGMDDPSYNYEVKIPDRYHDDDIYALAESYNAVFLPMKDRNRDPSDAQSSLLELDDIKDIFDEE